MAKRQIIPIKNTITVAGGVGQFDAALEGLILTYLVIEAGPVGAPMPKGKIKLIDLDQTPDQDIFKDPKPGDADVILDFYNFEMRIPLNGNYRFKIEDANRDGDYTVYQVYEERPRRV